MSWFGSDSAPDPASPEGRVTLARFESPVEAQIARGLLESAGLECFLVGENVNNLLGAAFRVWLQVRTEDEGIAREMLGSGGEAVEGDTGPPS
jgi:hypothetical protein